MRGKKIFAQNLRNLWGILENNTSLGSYVRSRRERFLGTLKREKTLVWEPCSVKLDFYLVEKGYDLDNLIKQCLDLLVDALVLADDNLVFNIEASVFEADSIVNEALRIEIYGWVTEKSSQGASSIML